MTVDQQAVVALHEEFGAMTVAECERMAFRRVLDDGLIRGVRVPSATALLTAHAQLVGDGLLVRSGGNLFRLA